MHFDVGKKYHARSPPSEPGEIAVDCRESQPSNVEGAESCAQPTEAGAGAR